MKIRMRKSSSAVLTAALFAAALWAVGPQVPARALAAAPGEEPAAVTTADAEIPADHLKLLVKPLTKEELTVEADGWRDLVKAKVQQVGQRQIAGLEQTASAESEAAEPTDQAPAGARESEEADKRQSQELAKSLVQLKAEQTQLVERLNVVLDALEKKGGEVESYRQYIGAIGGIDLNVGDTATIWTVVKGWLASEEGGRRWLWNIVKFLAILVTFYFAASIVAGLVRRGVSRVQNTSQLLVTFLGRFTKQVMMLVGVIVALSALEINISPLLAAIGAAGFVVAFALQDTLGNVASGLLILAYRPFDVGDVVEAADTAGVVEAVSLFSTHIRTFDNKLVIVPNNDIWEGTITNATDSDTRRVDMVFGIGYDDDVGKAKEILETLVKEHELVLDEPAPVVQLHELADSSVNFVCRPWTKTGDYWTVYWDITRAVKESFDRNGISIPFPQRDVHVYQETSAPAGDQATQHE